MIVYSEWKIHSSEEGNFKDYINPDSLKVVKGYAEPAIKNAKFNDRFQFLRKGYYCLDKDSSEEGIDLQQDGYFKGRLEK